MDSSKFLEDAYLNRFDKEMKSFRARVSIILFMNENEESMGEH